MKLTLILFYYRKVNFATNRSILPRPPLIRPLWIDHDNYGLHKNIFKIDILQLLCGVTIRARFECYWIWMLIEVFGMNRVCMKRKCRIELLCNADLLALEILNTTDWMKTIQLYKTGCGSASSNIRHVYLLILQHELTLWRRVTHNCAFEDVITLHTSFYMSAWINIYSRFFV